MSEGHDGGKGTGKMVVLTIFGLIVAIYVIQVINGLSQGDAHHGHDHGEAHAEGVAVQQVVVSKPKAQKSITAAQLAKVVAERDAALEKVKALEFKLSSTESRALQSEGRLSMVKRLLQADEALSK